MGPQYTESVDGKHRKGFNVVSYNYSDEPCLEMVIFLYVPSDVGLKILRYESVRGRGGTCNTCCLRDIRNCYNSLLQSKQLQMLTGGPNYIMIRRAIFGKVHGHGVKICLISQFPAKHTGVASGAKIVFTCPGQAFVHYASIFSGAFQ